jgi:hypothetical protein
LYSINDYLTPGSDAQLAALEGIMNHGYEKHGGDIPWASREEFGNAAMSDINTADRVLEVPNDDGTSSILFINSETQMVSYVNPSDPSNSTYFHTGREANEYGDTQIEEKGAVVISEDIVKGCRGEVMLDDPQMEEQAIEQETPEVTVESVPETVADEPAVEVSNEAPSVDADAAEGPER